MEPAQYQTAKAVAHVPATPLGATRCPSGISILGRPLEYLMSSLIGFKRIILIFRSIFSEGAKGHPSLVCDLALPACCHQADGFDSGTCFI